MGRGIIPRTLNYIFDSFSSIHMHSMFISYMEIYNEVGYDLLSSSTTGNLEELPLVIFV